MFSFELGNPDFNELEKKQIMSVQNIGPVGSTKLQETRKKRKPSNGRKITIFVFFNNYMQKH